MMCHKKKRSDGILELDKVLRKTFEENQAKYVGTVDRILVEKYSKDHWLGRNEQQVTVEFDAPKDANLVGTFQNVQLTSVQPFRFIGELV